MSGLNDKAMSMMMTVGVVTPTVKAEDNFDYICPRRSTDASCFMSKLKKVKMFKA